MTMKKQKTLHRFAAVAAVLLTLCLVFMMPVGAEGTAAEVNSWDELKAALSNGGVVKLGADITHVGDDSNKLTTSSSMQTTLDLNGHKLEVSYNTANSHYLITVPSAASFTIKDTSSSENGIVFLNYTNGQTDPYAHEIVVVYTNSGSIILDSGTIKVSSTVSGYRGFYGVNICGSSSFIMNGGKIDSGYVGIRVRASDTTNQNTIITAKITNGEITSVASPIFVHQPSSNAGGQNYKVEISDGTLTSKNRSVIAYWTQGTEEREGTFETIVSGGNLISESTSSNEDYFGIFGYCNLNGDTTPIDITKHTLTISGNPTFSLTGKGDFTKVIGLSNTEKKGPTVTITGGKFPEPTVLNYLGEEATAETVTVSLTENVDTSSLINIANGGATLKLNEHTLKRVDDGGATVIYMTANAKELDIEGPGTISTAKAGTVIQAWGGKLTVGNGVSVVNEVSSSQAVIQLGGNADASEPKVSIEATIEAGSKLQAKEGWAVGIGGKYPVTLSVSGTLNSGITVNGQSTVEHKITIAKDAKIDAANYPAIYAAGYGIWEIADGAELTGNEALSIKSGKFTINGGTFTATGEYKEPANANNNGSEDTGAAVSITSNDGYAEKIEVTITGGEFISHNGHAVYEGIGLVACKDADSAGNCVKGHSSHVQVDETGPWFVSDDGSTPKPAASESHLQTIAIENGKFTSASGKESVLLTQSDKTGFINGGTFSTDVSAYVKEGYVCVANGENSFVVMETDKNTVIPELPVDVAENGKLNVQDGAEVEVDGDTGTTVTITTEDDDTGYMVSIIVKDAVYDDNTNTVTTNPETSEYTVVLGGVNEAEEAGFVLSLPVENLNALPVIQLDIKEPVETDLKSEKPDVTNVLAMITAADANLEAVNENIGGKTITITFVVPKSLVPNPDNLWVYHVKIGETPTGIGKPTCVPDPDNEGYYLMTITSGLGFSSYVLAELKSGGGEPDGEIPEGTINTGSAVDTGSGNYQYYPRSVPADGIVDFGTSRVVTGMELPAGSDGTVTLNIKPTFAMPENGFYAFEIDAPGYNTDAKINGGLSFQIPVADLEAAGWTAEDIVLFHGTVGEDGKITWEALPTNLVKNENGVAYYKAAINSCSPFYIGFVKDGSVVNTEVVDPTTPETPVTPDEPEVLPPVDTPVTPEQPETPATPAPILAVFAGLGAAVVLRRK